MAAGARVAMRTVILSALLALLAAGSSPLCARPREKAADHPAKVVDAGTFAIMIAGRKVGTETFTIRQSADNSSTASSEIRIEDGDNKARQSSELRLGPTGELRRYEWHELQPGKGDLVLEPRDEFLVERISGEKDKRFEQPFLLPASTPVLDDFFFSHREILAWRYLATVCKQTSGQWQCSTQKAQFGIIIPRQRTSSMVSIEYVGRDRLALSAEQAELSHFRITSEDTDDWDIWLDRNQKLVRIVIASSKTEVVREPERAKPDKQSSPTQ